MQHIGQTLRERRRELDITQVELARQLRTSQSAIARIERTPLPTTQALARYLAALGYSFALITFPRDER